MSNSQEQKLKSKSLGLVNSPLLRPIIGAFLLLIALELALVLYLLHDIQQAEQTASLEYQYLTASQQWSDCADLMRRHRRVVDATRVKEDILAAKAEYDKSYREVREATQKLRDTFSSTPKLDGRPIVDSILLCLHCTSEIYDPRKTQAQRDRWYDAYLNASRRMYDTVLEQIRKIHAEIGNQNESEYQEEILLAGFLIVDLIICLYLASFIERQISRPLSELANSCRKLTSGEVLQAPIKQLNEIDYLQQTFHDMSISLSQHEQGRRSYIQLFKEMHSSRLLHIQSLIQELSTRVQQLKASKLELLESNVNRTLYLLDTMTQGLSFNQSAKVIPEYKETSSTELFQMVQSTLAFMLRSKSIALKIEDPGCKIFADPNLLSRALTNLLSNACKFSPRSSEIRLRGISDALKFRCEITDKGPGISSEQQQKLFKRFSQLDQNQVQGGSGLGLLISKQIVESHNGEIACTSQEGQGTTFWFEIPLQQSITASETPALGDVSRADKSVNKTGSIRTKFMAILLVFVAAQFIIAFQLNASLQQAAKRANSYTQQKSSIIETQRLLALFLSWRQRSYEAVVARNKRALLSLLPEGDEQVDISKNLLAKAPAKSKQKELFERIHGELNSLKALSPKLTSLETMPPLEAFPIVQIADASGKRIENDLFKALKVQSAALDRSYNLTSELRSTVSQLLVITLVINSILLLFLFLACVSIIEHLTQVNAKAQAFAQGKNTQASVKGNDELAVLDKSLCNAAQSIREAEHQRRELLAIINHDLRTPLTAMLMGFELLVAEQTRADAAGNLTEESLAKLERVNADIQFLIKQISDLLDLEKMESGALQPDSADLVIEELLEDTVGSLKPSAKPRIEYLAQESAEDIWVRGEMSLLRRIFEAVIQNALDYSQNALDNSAASAPVRLSISNDEQWAIINIKDNGPGIDKDLLQHIFDRFRFADGKPITGVGLPLAYRLAKIHGGKLEIQSSNDGTNVVIFLPRLIRQLKSAVSSS